MAGWRSASSGGYGRGGGSPTFEKFAAGSIARTSLKALTLSPWWLTPSRLFVSPRYYWARAEGNFNVAVRSLATPNSVWDRALIPTSPLAAPLITDER